MNGFLYASHAFSKDLLIHWRCPEFLDEDGDGRQRWHDAVLRNPPTEVGDLTFLDAAPVIGVHIYMDGPEGLFQVRTYGFNPMVLVQKAAGASELTIRLFTHARWLPSWTRPLDCADIPDTGANRRTIVIALHARGIRVRHVFDRP